MNWFGLILFVVTAVFIVFQTIGLVKDFKLRRRTKSNSTSSDGENNKKESKT